MGPARGDGAAGGGDGRVVDLPPRAARHAGVALALWLLSRLCKLETQGAPLPPAVRIVTGWGRHTPSWRGDRAAVRRAVTAALRVCGVPTVAAEGHVEIDVTKLGAWVEAAVASGVIRGYF